MEQQQIIAIDLPHKWLITIVFGPNSSLILIFKASEKDIREENLNLYNLYSYLWVQLITNCGQSLAKFD